MSLELKLLLAYVIIFISHPLSATHIAAAVGLVFFSRRVIKRKAAYGWLTIGLCIVLLLAFCTIEWFGWGLYDFLGWPHKRLLILYGICIIAGAGSGWLLYQGGWRHRAEILRQRHWGYVLRGLGLLLWSATFQITFAANIWWATI